MAEITDQTPWTTADPKVAPASRAKRKLRKKNRNERTAKFLEDGNVRRNAGTVGTLDQTFGAFQGNYLVTKVLHVWIKATGYTTSFDARKVLRGY